MILPGGFGTLDELFEALTLIQTGKILHFPILLFDSEHLAGTLDWVRNAVLEGRLLSPGDVDLLSVTDDIEEAVEIVVDCYERRCAHAGAPVM